MRLLKLFDHCLLLKNRHDKGLQKCTLGNAGLVVLAKWLPPMDYFIKSSCNGVVGRGEASV